ncbi:MAG: transcription-repair coupling factor [Clostridia bacterium]|nr:transcription-repair coupling factor [Lachnospiraceae bacterium]NCC00450.1 transcription-repair coupling factor [Clostridia bacterium]NCD02461.1 transcription-repair coupling factor [Clostridia bacterium]
MKLFREPLLQLNEYSSICQNLAGKDYPVYVEGCVDAQKTHWMASFSEEYPIKLIITHSEKRVKEIYEDYQFFDRNVYDYPARDIIFYSADVHGQLLVRQRLAVIQKLLEKEPVTVVTTIDGLMDSLLPPEKIAQQIIRLREGGTADRENMVKRLVHMGFERVFQVESPGQFSVRGGILDVYNLADDCPYRIEFWDDEIDTIRSFDAASQRSIERHEAVSIYPAAEMVFTDERITQGLLKLKRDVDESIKVFKKEGKAEEAGRLKHLYEETREAFENSFGGANVDSLIGYFYEEKVSFLDYFPKESTLIFLDEPARLREKAEGVAAEFEESMKSRLEKGYIVSGQMDVLRSEKEIFHQLGKRRCLMLSTLDQKTGMMPYKHRYHVTVQSIQAYSRNFELLVKDLKRWKSRKYRMVLVAHSKTRAQHLAKDLEEYNLTAAVTETMDRTVEEGQIIICHGNLHSGVEYPMIRFVILSESDIFGEPKRRKRKKSEYSGQKLNGFMDLSIGDYVVHENHGLGVYKGIEKIEIDKVEKDYIKIEYSGGDNLYILATQLDMIQKYAGADAKRPKLNRLGGQEWGRTKTRVRGAVKDLAEDLIKLYAVRQSQEGFAYGPDTIWQQEFEEAFPYEETDDQLTAIEAAKRDMESHRIMDRLICGDVGYGKTEVAIRAAFKAVQDGKQVVLLVPTTILAQQHYNTFTQRMKDYPINIRTMSRFRTKAEQAATVKELKKGMVDILIGTHRVLSKDIEFKNLGLLIVDEEQRFGVTHKEKIKKLRENVDVLTLTATPIPRTLHMSLIGIRDMSVLGEPPMDRMPVQTYVMEYNEEMVREAIAREVGRGGQVYYVFNRVNGIVEMTAAIQKLAPDAEVAFAHGQMSERELEKVMYRFINGEIDVLVSTTIIETGLDISNVNTVIIHDADRLGLSQLYQLRGRVGRSNRTAYAFLLYRRNTILKEVAEKRLAAIREFTEFGSGFKIAMRDLEIRGAGNLLGQQQSGHMESVGYDLYCKMLNEEVLKLKGETVVDDDFETVLELDVDAYIPATYIKNEVQKLEIYKRIAGVATEEEYDEMIDELSDRFGDLPKSAQNLLDIALLKAEAHEACITQLSCKGDETKIYLYNRAAVCVERIPELVARYGRRMKFKPGDNPYFILKMRKEEQLNLLKCEKNVIKDVKGLLENGK